MSGYSDPPSLVRDLRDLKSRLGELERAQLASDDAAWHTATLVNGFTHAEFGWAPVAWYKDTFGRVYLRGVAHCPADVPAGTTMFTIAEGFRPVYSHQFVCPTTDTGFETVTIGTSGAVVHDTANSSIDQLLSLDSVQFRTV